MHRTRALVFCSLLIVAAPKVATTQGNAGTHKPIVPVSPAELFPFLPATPRGWELKESTAKNSFIGWISAQASREFQQPPPQPSPGSTPGPPAITRVRVMDTGYYASFNGDFENFRVGKYPGAETLIIAGMPARKIILSATRERLRVSVRGRFIVEIETLNQRPNSGQAWLPLFDFRRIASIPDSGASELPKPITIQAIDELHPANNSSSQLFWGGPTPVPE